jgi:hypothetical protein
MNRRHALAVMPAALYAAACNAEQDKPGTRPGATPAASYPSAQQPRGDEPPPAVRTTSQVRITVKGDVLDVTPQIFLLLLPKGRVRSSLKWEVDLPADHTAEINFVVGYEGDLQTLKNKELPSDAKRGPFAATGDQARGRYQARGRAVLDSGPVDVQGESYWKYEVTVTRPGKAPLVIDPGGIIKDWP